MSFDEPNLKAFIEHSNTKDDVYNNFNDYNPKRKPNFDCFWLHDCWYKH